MRGVNDRVSGESNEEKEEMELDWGGGSQRRSSEWMT